MSIIRKRSASQKAYIPNNARDNHYLLAEFPLTDSLINALGFDASAMKNYGEFYQILSNLLFQTSEEFEVKNSVLIANDKLARVRFSQEMHQWQTNQQILFYYNPQYHELQKSVYDANYRTEKITLLFLATGNDLRINAASFHARIEQVLNKFRQKLAVESLSIRVRDHQHLTYDLFAKHKSGVESVAHKMRTIKARYASQHVELPESVSQMTYAVVNLAVNNQLVNMADIDLSSSDPYNPFYTLITDAFTLASKRYNLNNGALIANGLIPIVRNSKNETISTIGELQMLGYNPEHSPCGFVSKWDAQNLVDNIQLIFVATKENQADSGHARFLNQIEQAVRLMATELELSPKNDEVIVRFHQHVAYDK